MKICQGNSWREFLPINGAGSDIDAGALLSPGTITADDATRNKSTWVLANAALDDVSSVLLADHDFSVAGESTPEDGDAYVQVDVEQILPATMLSGEHDLAAAQISVLSAVGSAITITNLEDNIDGAWLLAVAGPGVGHLGFVITSAAGVATLKSAPATAFTAATDVIKILPDGHTLGLVNTGRDKFASQAAVGTAKIRVMYSEIDIDGSGWDRLDPTKNDGRIVKLNQAGTGLGIGVKVRTFFTLENSWFTPND